MLYLFSSFDWFYMRTTHANSYNSEMYLWVFCVQLCNVKIVILNVILMCEMLQLQRTALMQYCRSLAFKLFILVIFLDS